VRVQLQPAYVLHGRPYRDSSQLLEIFTPEYGRVSVVAKGARRSTKGSSRGAILQPFIPLLLSFSGRTDLKTLTGSEVAGEICMLRGQRLFSGMYLNELLVRLLHTLDAQPELFSNYAQSIAELAGDNPVDVTLRRFEFVLLDELGYSFDLTTDGHSGLPVQALGWYQYHIDYGLVEHTGSRQANVPVFSGAELLAISRDEQSSTINQTSKRLLRQVLAGHLGDKPLKSRELFRPSNKSAPVSGEHR
jgi:DNA repair protein RecO (recombination protein O)